MQPLLTVPNLIGMLRLGFAIVLVPLAILDEPDIFTVILIAAFVLDMIDGPIARYLDQTSAQGSRLDTVADFSVYMALVFGVWQLWPQIFAGQQLFIGAAVLSMLLPLFIALVKFRTFTSYHTWLVKFATVCIAPGALILILNGPDLPFRIACVISGLAGLEQIIITYLLDQPRADVRHVVAVYRQRKTG